MPPTGSLLQHRTALDKERPCVIADLFYSVFNAGTQSLRISRGMTKVNRGEGKGDTWLTNIKKYMAFREYK